MLDCRAAFGVPALSTATPEGAVCCLKIHRRHLGLYDDRRIGRKRKAANEISSPATTASGGFQGNVDEIRTIMISVLGRQLWKNKLLSGVPTTVLE
jgi:hypothetical protein